MFVRATYTEKWWGKGGRPSHLLSPHPAPWSVKGFVALHGEGRRALVELAGNRVHFSFGEPWENEAEPKTQLVFIGEGLDEAALRRQLWACRATGSSPRD